MSLSAELSSVVYRPTVRYHPLFEKYVNQLFHETTLDRNQIIRLALFASPFSGLYQSRLDRYTKSGVTRSGALWTPKDTGLWKELYDESL